MIHPAGPDAVVTHKIQSTEKHSVTDAQTLKTTQKTLETHKNHSNRFRTGEQIILAPGFYGILKQFSDFNSWFLEIFLFN